MVDKSVIGATDDPFTMVVEYGINEMPLRSRTMLWVP